jgi:hypothetical protein
MLYMMLANRDLKVAYLTKNPVATKGLCNAGKTFANLSVAIVE